MKHSTLKNWFIATLGVLALAISCVDEPYKYQVASGVPEIYFIRPAGTAKDTLLTGAYMGNSLCIVGNNLRSTYRVLFNDCEAVLNSSFMTDHTILLEVPNKIPGEVSDNVYLITKQQDTVKFPFQVLVPGPVVSEMSCEWAAEGSVATISGDYFIDDPNVPLTLTFPGNKQAQISSFSKTLLTFTVPEGAAEGPVTVKTVYGSVESAFHYKDSRGILFDFDTDPRLKCHGWHNALFIGSDETSLNGNYLRLGDGNTVMNDEAWADGQFSFEYWPGDWDSPVTYADSPRLTELVDFTDWENMLLKFELNVPASNPWSAGMMQIIVGGVDKITGGAAGATDIDGNTLAGANNTFFNNNTLPRGLYQPWAGVGSFDTGGEWITVTIPYKNFVYASDGTQASGKLTASDFSSLTLFVWKGVGGSECTPIIKIDNIRAVPNK